MDTCEYERIFTQYFFGGSELAADLVTLDALGEQSPVDWLAGHPRLVLRMKAAQQRCLVAMSAALQPHATQLKCLPTTAENCLAEDVEGLLGEMCRHVYPPDAVIYIVTERNYYCTPTSLRLMNLEGMQRATPDNVEEIRAALIPGIADKPEYLSGKDILGYGPAFAWYQDRQPVGFAGTHASFMRDSVGNVGMVFVKEAYRRRGAGTALVAAVADALLARGRLPVYGCFANNIASTHSAEKAGFLFAGFSCRVFVADDMEVHINGEKPILSALEG